MGLEWSRDQVHLGSSPYFRVHTLITFVRSLVPCKVPGDSGLDTFERYPWSPPRCLTNPRPFKDFRTPPLKVGSPGPEEAGTTPGEGQDIPLEKKVRQNGPP